MTKLEMEKLSLERARNKNVVDLLQVLDDESTCVLVFENCVLGDLVRQVVLHDKRPLEAYVFPTIIKPVLLGLQHMHKQVRLLYLLPAAALSFEYLDAASMLLWAPYMNLSQGGEPCNRIHKSLKMPKTVHTCRELFTVESVQHTSSCEATNQCVCATSSMHSTHTMTTATNTATGRGIWTTCHPNSCGRTQQEIHMGVPTQMHLNSAHLSSPRLLMCGR